MSDYRARPGHQGEHRLISTRATRQDALVAYEMRMVGLYVLIGCVGTLLLIGTVVLALGGLR